MQFGNDDDSGEE
jgi:hypothetical protein